MDNKKPSWLDDIEHLHSAVEDMAEMYGMYLRALEKAGFTRQEAYGMVLGLQATISIAGGALDDA